MLGVQLNWENSQAINAGQVKKKGTAHRMPGFGR